MYTMTRSMYLAYTSRSPGCGRKHPSTLPAVRPDVIGWAADAFPELEIRRSISCMIDCARREWWEGSMRPGGPIAAVHHDMIECSDRVIPMYQIKSWYELYGSTSSSCSNTSLCRRVQIAPTKRLRGCPRPPPAPRQLQRGLRRVKTAKTVGLRASGSSTPPQRHTPAPRRPQ